MASKTIMVQEETYNYLLKLKRGNESFNDIIMRLILQAQDLTPYFGLLTEAEADAIENAIDEGRAANDAADEGRQEV